MCQPRVTFVGPLTWRGISDGVELQLGLLSLAAVLAPMGIVAEIVDLNLLDQEGSLSKHAIGAILATDPDVVGFGTICSSYPLTLRLAEEVKRLRPATTILLGGPQASVVDRATMLAFPSVDFVVRGEAEESLPRLLDALCGARFLSGVEGITYRSDRRIIRNRNAPPIADLDALPLPLYDYYQGLDRRASLPVEAGRGCPFACRFCSTNDFFRRRFRLKSSPKLVSEMMMLHARYGVGEFQLTHDMFTVDRKRIVAFCEELLRQPHAVHWRCSARTDCVDAELLALMQRAGCSGIFFGIETGSQRLQHLIEKNLDLSQARVVLDQADRLGIDTTASLITAYPQEEPADLDGTIGFFGEAIRLDRCEPQLHLLAPLADTPLTTQYEEQLIYHKVASDISGRGDRLEPVDELLVLAHPEIFSSFYAFPCALDRGYLHQLRSFVLALSSRARGLLLAFHSEVGSLRSVFDLWQTSCGRASDSVNDYRSWSWFSDFLHWVSERYVGQGYVAIEVTWRFYQALAAAALHDLPALPSSTPFETTVRWSPSVRIVSICGDVLGVLACLREAVPASPALLEGTRTLAVDISGQGANQIRQLPPLSALVLRLCRDGISLTDLRRELGAAQWSVHKLDRAIRILEQQGLLETVEPLPVAMRAAS